MDNETKPGLQDYCDITSTHTMCQFKPGQVSQRCGKLLTNKITEQIKQRLLDHNNDLRRRVARGEEPSQPAAANMRELVHKPCFMVQCVTFCDARSGMKSSQIFLRPGQTSVTAYSTKTMCIHASMNMVEVRRELHS